MRLLVIVVVVVPSSFVPSVATLIFRCAVRFGQCACCDLYLPTSTNVARSVGIGISPLGGHCIIRLRGFSFCLSSNFPCTRWMARHDKNTPHNIHKRVDPEDWGWSTLNATSNHQRTVCKVDQWVECVAWRRNIYLVWLPSEHFFRSRVVRTEKW